MPFIPVPNAVQVQLNYRQDAQRVQNSFGVIYTSEPDLTALQTLAADVKTWWDASLFDNVPGSLTLDNITVIGLWAQNAIAIEYTTGLPTSGGDGTNAPLPNNVTVAFKLSTALRGRSNRGRIFHIGLVENQVVGNNVEPAALATLTEAYQNLRTALLAEGRGLAVISKYTGGAPRTTGIATLVTTVSCDGVIDSQRRRLPGRGG